MRIVSTVSAFIDRHLPPASPMRSPLVLAVAAIALVTFYLLRKLFQQPQPQPQAQLELEPSSPTTAPQIEPVASLQPEKPPIVAQISVHTDKAMGTVEHDKKFGFSGRLRDVHKKLIKVNPWDQYIPLWHNNTIPPIKDRKGFQENFILPSCVFEYAQDNLLEFYLDDQLYQLTLINHCMEDTPFDVALAGVMNNPVWGDLYPEDVEGLQCFGNIVIHDSKNVTQWSPEKINVAEFTQDQQRNGKYIQLRPGTVLRDQNLTSKYHVYEVTTMKGPYVLLIIPHNRRTLDELNRGRISTSYGATNRPQTYFYGQYYAFHKTHRIASYRIGFDATGRLDVILTRKPDPIVATIGINMTSWAIDDDKKFEFGKRLTLTDGTPVPVKPTDRYISLWRGLQIKDATGNLADPVLPSSLLTGIKEGETIEFYLDDQLYELTIEQNEPPFEEVLQKAMEAQFEHFYFPEDVVGKIQLCGQVIHNYKAITNTILTQCTPEVLDATFYQQDQKDNGVYEVLGHGNEGRDYNFTAHDNLQSGFHLYQIENSKGRFFLTIIPHHLKSKKKASSIQRTPFPIEKNSFYHHGRYCLIHLPDNIETYTVGFNKNAFLTYTPVLKTHPKIK